MFFDHLSPSILGVEFKTVWFPKKKIETAAISFTKPTPIMSEHKSHLRAFGINQSLNCTNTVKTYVKAPPPSPYKPTNLWLQAGKDCSSIWTSYYPMFWTAKVWCVWFNCQWYKILDINIKSFHAPFSCSFNGSVVCSTPGCPARGWPANAVSHKLLV